MSNICLPSQRANAAQVLNQCQVLMDSGLDLELYITYRFVKPEQAGRMADLKKTFGLTRLPRIIQVPCFDLSHIADRLPGPLPLILFYFQHLSFLFLTLIILAFRRPEAVYTRELHLAWLGGRILQRLGIRVVTELHDLAQTERGDKLTRLALRRMDGLALITHGLKKALDDRGLIPPGLGRIGIVPDGVSRAFFQDRGEPREIRQRLGLPSDGPLILYAGGLYWAWKGVSTLIQAQAEMRERGWLVIVGGSPVPESIENLKVQAAKLGLKKVIFTGWVEPTRIPEYLAAADILALPNSAKAEISRSYTSPLKLFEYLASGRPVAGSDLPSLREVLRHGENGLLFEPDNPNTLARTMERLLDEPELAARLGSAGRETAGQYTWAERAKKIRRIAG